jgi:hypothetical protein
MSGLSIAGLIIIIGYCLGVAIGYCYFSKKYGEVGYKNDEGEYISHINFPKDSIDWSGLGEVSPFIFWIGVVLCIAGC